MTFPSLACVTMPDRETTKQPDDHREVQKESRSNVHAGNRLSLGGGIRAMQADRAFS